MVTRVINTSVMPGGWAGRPGTWTPSGWLPDGWYFPSTFGAHAGGLQMQPIPGYFANNQPNDSGVSPAPMAPQFSSKVVFDTIGQTIYRSIGHVATPMRLIWVDGISNSGEDLSTATMTAAYALCHPIDPSEEGSVAAIYSGGSAIYDPDQGGVVIPEGTDPTVAALLTTALNNAIVYPGDEAQDPAPLIVSDKGSSRTPGFRGLRYIIIPAFPLGFTGGVPSLSASWERSNDIETADGAVEFAAGSE